MTQAKDKSNSAQGELIAKPPTLIERLTAGESPFLLPEDLQRVVHLKCDSYDVRIDRATKWGNPFALSDYGGDRLACLLAFAKHMDHWLRTDTRAHGELGDLRGKVLGCWCSPKACHGHVLTALASTKDDADREAWIDGLIGWAEAQ